MGRKERPDQFIQGDVRGTADVSIRMAAALRRRYCFQRSHSGSGEDVEPDKRSRQPVYLRTTTAKQQRTVGSCEAAGGIAGTSAATIRIANTDGHKDMAGMAESRLRRFQSLALQTAVCL